MNPHNYLGILPSCYMMDCGTDNAEFTDWRMGVPINWVGHRGGGVISYR